MLHTLPTELDPRLDPLLASVPQVEGFKALSSYLLISVIGRGGTGAVYRARHARTKGEVAVKCLFPELAKKPGFVERLRVEAQAAAKVRHPNLVWVQDLDAACGIHFLVMEYVHGENLRTRVRRKGRLDIDEALMIVRLAARGLGAGHAHNIIHRDIKPDNILISATGEVKVADMGLAKRTDDTEGNLTINLEGAPIIGTPQYMPPEQWEGLSRVSQAGDVWALGATLYFLLTGRDAIERGSLPEMWTQVREREFPDPRVYRPELPAEVVGLIRACTVRDPLLRPASALDMQRLLDPLCSSGDTTLLEDPETGSHTVHTLISPPRETDLDRAKSVVLHTLPAIQAQNENSEGSWGQETLPWGDGPRASAGSNTVPDDRRLEMEPRVSVRNGALARRKRRRVAWGVSLLFAALGAGAVVYLLLLGPGARSRPWLFPLQLVGGGLQTNQYSKTLDYDLKLQVDPSRASSAGAIATYSLNGSETRDLDAKDAVDGCVTLHLVLEPNQVNNLELAASNNSERILKIVHDDMAPILRRDTINKPKSTIQPQEKFDLVFSEVASSSNDFDAAGVWLFGVPESQPQRFQFMRNGRWELLGVQLPEGSHALSVIGRDRAGNETSFDLDLITVDGTAPQFAGVEPPEGTMLRSGDTRFLVRFNEELAGVPTIAGSPEARLVENGRSLEINRRIEPTDEHLYLSFSAKDLLGNSRGVALEYPVDPDRTAVQLLEAGYGPFTSLAQGQVMLSGTAVGPTGRQIMAELIPVSPGSSGNPALAIPLGQPTLPVKSDGTNWRISLDLPEDLPDGDYRIALSGKHLVFKGSDLFEPQEEGVADRCLSTGLVQVDTHPPGLLESSPLGLPEAPLELGPEGLQIELLFSEEVQLISPLPVDTFGVVIEDQGPAGPRAAKHRLLLGDPDAGLDPSSAKRIAVRYQDRLDNPGELAIWLIGPAPVIPEPPPIPLPTFPPLVVYDSDRGLFLIYTENQQLEYKLPAPHRVVDEPKWDEELGIRIFTIASDAQGRTVESEMVLIPVGAAKGPPPIAREMEVPFLIDRYEISVRRWKDIDPNNDYPISGTQDQSRRQVARDDAKTKLGQFNRKLPYPPQWLAAASWDGNRVLAINDASLFFTGGLPVRAAITPEIQRETRSPLGCYGMLNGLQEFVDSLQPLTSEGYPLMGGHSLVQSGVERADRFLPSYTDAANIYRQGFRSVIPLEKPE